MKGLETMLSIPIEVFTYNGNPVTVPAWVVIVVVFALLANFK